MHDWFLIHGQQSTRRRFNPAVSCQAVGQQGRNDDAGGDGNASQDIGVQLMSMGFIGVGIFTLLIAMRQHKRELIRLRSDPYLYRDEPSLSIARATAVLAIGVLAFLLLLSGLI